jgi:muramoyltetrapeptide carboxypeptidase
MNRKKFLSSILVAGTGMSFLGAGKNQADLYPELPIIIPKQLEPGDIIGISCPAGFITDKEIESAIQQFQNWGFLVKIGKTINQRDFIYGGTDEERIKDFQQMLDDVSIKAIMCARGGYGSVRIIDKLDFTKFKNHPKWIIGFSDITVIHSHLNRNYQVASIHSKMCNSFPDDWSRAEPTQIDSILSIRKVLQGEQMKYPVVPNSNNKIGVAEGPLVGGNLKTLESLSGTKSDIITSNKILFVEDTGEYLYSIDRMFWNLKRTGKLAELSGLIIGGFKVRPDDPGEEFGKTIYDIVLEKISEYNYPVCFDFPVGHQKENYALCCGVNHKLIVQKELSTLIEVR